MIYLDISLSIFLIYPVGRYVLIPAYRKKSIVLTYKELALIFIPIMILALSNFLNLSMVIIALILFSITFILMILNLWLIFGSTKENIITSVNKTAIGMSLESKVVDNKISIPIFSLIINTNSMFKIYFIRFNSSLKSEKLNLFKTVTRKFITA